MKRFLKEFIKQVATRLNYHRQGDEDDILILSSPRSGSTWLMEILYTQPGVKYINEPLGKNILDYHRFLPLDTRWRYVSLTSSEERVLERYFREDRPIGHFGPVNVFGRGWSLLTDRRVFKVIRALPLIEWFSNSLDVQVIYLVRHPIAQSLSCIKRGHRCAVGEYLSDYEFVGKHFNEELREFGHQVLATGSDLEKFITEWCLDNAIPLQKIEDRDDWLCLSYEELVIDPKKTLGLLYDSLNLTDKQRLFSRVRVPSRVTDSSSEVTRKQIEEGKQRYLITKWKQQVSDEAEGVLFEIIERFGIDAYRPGRYLADETLLNFGRRQLGRG